MPIISMRTDQATEGEQGASLVRRLKERDPLALGDLYDQYGGLVYRMALCIVREVPATEDLTQEIFLSIWTRIGTFDSRRGTLAGWIRLMTRCQAIDYLRSRDGRDARASVPLEEVEPCACLSATSLSFLRAEQIRLLEGPWKRLKRHEQHALRLAYYSGFSQSEIAQILNRPLGTIKTWMRHALQSLRADLEGANAG